MRCRFLAILCLLSVAIPAFGQGSQDSRWCVATNAADLAYLFTVNASGQYSISRHLSIEAQTRWNPWTFRNSDDADFRSRQRTFSLGTRWWPWYTYSGWWLGARGQYQEYNSGGLRSPETEEGDAWGLAISGGYSLQICKWFNVDLGLGFWGGYKRYTAYACPTCGRIVGNGEKGFILPDELLVSAMFIF